MRYLRVSEAGLQCTHGAEDSTSVEFIYVFTMQDGHNLLRAYTSEFVRASQRVNNSVSNIHSYTFFSPEYDTIVHTNRVIRGTCVIIDFIITQALLLYVLIKHPKRAFYIHELQTIEWHSLEEYDVRRSANPPLASSARSLCDNSSMSISCIEMRSISQRIEFDA
jgi:hypothetical protein